MEFGLIPQLDEFSFNSQKETQTINATKASREVLEQPDIKEYIKKQNTEKSLKQEESTVVTAYKEFVLTNFNFGFNNDSKDFFVKTIRGEAENQYPTDDMMRLKAYLIKENQVAS